MLMAPTSLQPALVATMPLVQSELVAFDRVRLGRRESRLTPVIMERSSDTRGLWQFVSEIGCKGLFVAEQRADLDIQHCACRRESCAGARLGPRIVDAAVADALESELARGAD